MVKKRQLVLLNTTGAAVGGYKCDQCGRVFLDRDTGSAEMQRKIRADFEAHSCHEDVSQAAFRIVREATEGK